MISAYLVDDESLALERLSRMLEATGRVDIVGMSIDPVHAVEQLRTLSPDVLFLDIHMPGLSGFDLLAQLQTQPLVIFTTAYDRYALEAFKVHSVDYLLKPIEPEHLDRAITKAERFNRREGLPIDIGGLLARVGASLGASPGVWLDRIASRSGDKVEPIDLRRVTHFFSEDKLTFASTPERTYVVNATVSQLEQRLDPARFIRIHRGTILNLDHLLELRTLFGGRMVARLKDGKKTELPVSRDRLGALKERLGV